VRENSFHVTSVRQLEEAPWGVSPEARWVSRPLVRALDYDFWWLQGLHYPTASKMRKKDRNYTKHMI
jgi:hypothetical protein